jgi:NADPH:quinone reductase-like Zn-dependent oxidoreductase
MKSLQFDTSGGLGSLRVVEVDDPEPGPGEVLVRMRAISLNYRDLIVIGGGGHHKPREATPRVPFSDGCGIVDKVGADVERIAVGDRVCPIFFQDWIDGPATAPKLATPLVGPVPGVGRELAVYPAHGLVKVPDLLSDAEAASLPCAGVTAWNGLYGSFPLLPGSTVLLIGTGGVSILGLQFAVAAGCRTIILSSSDEKLERAKAMGATHGVNYRAHPEWAREVRRLTDGLGVDIVLEVGGNGTLRQSLRALRVGGHLALIGLLASGASDFDIASMLGGQASLKVIGVGSRAHFEQMNALIETAGIHPVIDRAFPWEQAGEALAYLESGQHFGKVVLEF